MGKKISLTPELKKILIENGIDHSDFLTYLTKNPDNGVTIEKTEHTLLQIIDFFIEYLVKYKVLGIKSSTTIKYYLSFLLRFKEFILRYNKEILFKDLNEIIFNEFLHDTNKGKLNHNSMNTYLRIIKRLCTFANQNDYYSKNISYKFHLLTHSSLPRYFNEDQILALLTETNKHKKSYLWKTIFITFLGSGLRIHELSALKIKDIDFKGNTIFTLGKGSKERYIPLYPFVKIEILKYLKFTGVTDLILAKDGFLFSRVYGYDRIKPISIRSIQENFTNIVKPLNLDSRYTVHSFRHTFAVDCLKANMQLAYLSQILGHRDPSTTVIYTKLLPKDLQKVIDEKYPLPLEKLINQIMSKEDGFSNE